MKEADAHTLDKFAHQNDTPTNVWLGALYEYYKPEGERNASTLQEIHKKGEFFDIQRDINYIRDNFRHIDEELDDPKYYTIWSKTASGKEIKWGPVRNSEEWQKACKYLQRNEMTMPTALRRKLATKLLNTTKEFGVEMDYNQNTYLSKRAGLGFPIFNQISQELYKRAEMYGNTELKKIAEACKDMVAQDGIYEYLDKLAELVSDLDVHNQLCHNYREIDLTPPDEFLYSVSDKTAEEMVSSICTLKDGNTYTYNQLAKVPFEKLAEVFGDDMAQEALEGLNISPKKVAEMAETLPLPQAQMFSDVLADMGSEPIDKEASVNENIWNQAQRKQAADNINK